VIDAYVEQLHFAEDQGAGVVLMASRHLARAASAPADYAHVYREVLARAGARSSCIGWVKRSTRSWAATSVPATSRSASTRSSRS
jgi:hypothetical protein